MTIPMRCNLNSRMDPHLQVSLILVAQTSQDGLDHALRVLWAAHRNGDRACVLSRIVIPAHKQGIADVDHLFQRDAEDVAQLANSVSLINAWLRDIDGGRPSKPNGESGN